MADRDLATVINLVNQFQQAYARGDRATVNDIIAQLVAMRAPIGGGQWEQLAYHAAGNGELGLARQAMDLLVAALGGGPAAQFKKVTMLALLGIWREADALLRTLPDAMPDAATHAYYRGTAALNLGRLDEARGYFEQATRLRPNSGLAWFSLSLATNFSRAPTLADRLIAAGPEVERAAPHEHVSYLYALGKVHAERGEHRLAFEAFARAMRQLKSRGAHNRDEDRASAARAVEGYSAERIAALARQQPEPTGRTIFVTGLPRSGTTLVEQILTSHSAVSDGGETGYQNLLAREVGGASYPALARYVEARGAAPAARLWHHWLDEFFPGSTRVVEKTVDASRFLGLFAALLPEAPLIWVMRDPLDRAWSCFRTHFSATASPWRHDLADIAAHFRLEDRLLAQWQDILGERLLVLPYEALVTDPDLWIRRILTHCGLAVEPAVFAPHVNQRPVATASMVQVRRPINREGIGAAEPYREFLQPFIDAYYG